MFFSPYFRGWGDEREGLPLAFRSPPTRPSASSTRPLAYGRLASRTLYRVAPTPSSTRTPLRFFLELFGITRKSSVASGIFTDPDYIPGMKRFRRTIRDPDSLGGRGKRGSRVGVFDVEIDLHGMTGDEAVSDVEEVLASLDEGDRALIIHGKGDGVLRTRVRAFLGSTDLVSRVEYGESENLPGGAGVTAVRI